MVDFTEFKQKLGVALPANTIRIIWRGVMTGYAQWPERIILLRPGEEDTARALVNEPMPAPFTMVSAQRKLPNSWETFSSRKRKPRDKTED